MITLSQPGRNCVILAAVLALFVVWALWSSTASSASADHGMHYLQSSTSTCHAGLHLWESTAAPETEAELCIAVVSCKRPHLLNATLTAVSRHFGLLPSAAGPAAASSDASLRTQLMWVDNGSGANVQADVLSSFSITAAVLFPDNCGLPRALNLLYRALCTAPYVLVLEEDWLLRADAPVDVVRRAMTVLAVDDGVSTVYLRAISDEAYTLMPWHSIQAGDSNNSDSSSGNSSGRVKYRHHCPAPGSPWGAYTNGASVMRRDMLVAAGPMSSGGGYTPEMEYSARIAGLGGKTRCAAVMQLHPPCEGTGCNAAFDHKGGGQRSPGWESPTPTPAPAPAANR